jgi:hypothetical protein
MERVAQAVEHDGATSWRYAVAAMAVDTATIRVASDTRDLLAAEARQRGISLSALLAEIARERELEAMFESERQAVLAEVGDPLVEEEMRLWESTLEDGIDFDDGLTFDE